MNDYGKKYLGIEIGGTKLQLAVGTAEDARLEECLRADVDPSRGAIGIVQQIHELGSELCARHDVAAIGVGFGGPIDVRTGRVTTSHQIAGWDGFPLLTSLQETFSRPVRVDNDCNVAALAEAEFGAGEGSARVFYVTVGTGIGGGFVVERKVDGNHRPAISEIGHLRPGPSAIDARETVESIASGWGIARRARTMVAMSAVRETTETASDEVDEATAQLWAACRGDLDQLTTKQICDPALRANRIVHQVLGDATTTLGWGIAQVITLLAPNVVVVGGGVSLMGARFFEPLGAAVRRYVFPPLTDSYSILPAALGEEVVLHGALLIARAQE